MLTLKLTLVPVFLLLITLASRRWGPQIAGWIAALPVVTGPILFVIALERGADFTAGAATASLSGVAAAVSFGAAYSHCARVTAWPGALLGGLGAWLAAAAVLAMVPASLILSLVIALASLLAVPYVFPKPGPQVKGVTGGNGELLLRMAAGAALTLAVTMLAGALGAWWSGLLAVSPLLSSVLAVFSHRNQSAGFAAALLRGLAGGLYSFLVFCLVLALALPRLGIAGGFVCAIAAAIAVQAATRGRARNYR